MDPSGIFSGNERKEKEQEMRRAGRLPPGQSLTLKWPVLHYGSVPKFDPASWNFRVWGLVDAPITLSWDAFNRLPKVETDSDFHCVTRWSRFDVTFEGVSWGALEHLVRPRASAQFVVAHAEEGYTANVPIASLRDPYALLATHADGAPLTPDHGGPLRLVIPGKYFWKSAKWLRGIELTSTDRPGFWERYGYSNEADPFKEERYAF